MMRKTTHVHVVPAQNDIALKAAHGFDIQWFAHNFEIGQATVGDVVLIGIQRDGFVSMSDWNGMVVSLKPDGRNIAIATVIRANVIEV